MCFDIRLNASSFSTLNFCKFIMNHIFKRALTPWEQAWLPAARATPPSYINICQAIGLQARFGCVQPSTSQLPMMTSPTSDTKDQVIHVFRDHPKLSCSICAATIVRKISNFHLIWISDHLSTRPFKMNSSASPSLDGMVKACKLKFFIRVQ